MINNSPIISSTARNFMLIAFFLFYSLFTSAQTTYSISPESYVSVHYKGKAMITASEQYRSCQYNLVNVIDSFLFVQINVAGIDIGKVLATPTNILLINKIEKKYYQGDYSFFQHFIDIDLNFYTIQALFNNFPFSIPVEVELSYQKEFSSGDYSFFQTILCKYEKFEVEIEVKKVTFNEIPEVSAIIPKNFTQIFFNEEE